ncbi:MAG: helix-turn-helix domain-containing protein, partial [Acidimicrobiales bacterium]
MPRTGRPKQVLELTGEEREQLVRWERRRKSSQALAFRSRIVLACAEGHANTEVARRCGVSPPTVGKWRRRFCELRLDGLSDDPRPYLFRTLFRTPPTRSAAELDPPSRSTVTSPHLSAGILRLRAA